MSKNGKRIVMVDPDLDPEIQKLVRKAVADGTFPRRKVVDETYLTIGLSFGVVGSLASANTSLMYLNMAAGAAFGLAPNLLRTREIKVHSAARKAYVAGRYRKGAYPSWMEGEELARRADEAATYVLSSRVHQDDQLDSANNALVLPRQVWDLMGDLQDLDNHIEKTPKVDNAATTAHHRIIEQIQINCERRVQALETYALQVMEADKRYGELKAMETLEIQSSGLLDLLARTSTVDASIAEVNALTGQAAALVEGYRTALAAAREAGLALTVGK